MPTNPVRLIGAIPLSLAAALLAGCAHYSALPLDASPRFASAPTTLADAPKGPLSVEDVVALALANNPELKAARLKRAVAAGTTKQAGILPNPTLSGAFLPLLSGVGTVSAWNIGLSQNIKAIVTYRSHRRAAQDSGMQVAADVVWQEWQVAGTARQLTGDLILGARARLVYAEACRLLGERNAKLERALAAGNVTLANVAPDRAALLSARTALNSFDQHQLALAHQLKALLGLAPDAVLPLATEATLPPFSPAAIRDSLPSLPARRPDLLALRLGYAAADETVRQAILSQFPDLVLGGSVASDNARVINGGPNANVGLPIFDRNQGNIAIARATRAQLNADYSARLTAAMGQVSAMLAEWEQLSTQLAAAQRDLPAARMAAERARTAFGQSNLDERTAVDLITTSLAKEQDIMTLELAMLDRQIAIQTLVGAGLPVAELPAEPGTGGQP